MPRLCQMLSFATLLALVTIGLSEWAVDAQALSCPLETEHLRLQQGYASTLPDCRAYEQVSPVDKNLADARGGSQIVHSSTSGERVTFFSIIPFPLQGVSGSDTYPVYLSTRGREEWSTQGLVPPALTGFYHSEVDGWTNDLTTVLVTFSGLPTPETPNFYLYNSLTGENKLLAEGPTEIYLVDAASDDSRILFEDEARLRSNGTVESPGTPGVSNLYEWASGQVDLVAADASAGAEVESQISYYKQNAISENGLRIYFTNLPSQQIFLREQQSEQTEKTVEVSKGRAKWLAATPDGAKAFFIEGGNLYRFDAATEPHDLAITGGAGEVLGTLGVSTDGTYAYFAATGVLAGKNAEGRSPAEGSANIYLWHQGGHPEIVFVAQVDKFHDVNDWTACEKCSGEIGNSAEQKSSRVSSDGTTLLLSSTDKLTPYENGSNGEKYFELYLYNASTEQIRCVSCNPNGSPAISDAYLVDNVLKGGQAQVPTMPFLTNNLSYNGNRVFFETEESLLPQDTDGQIDVYEWEREGYSSCVDGNGNGSGGCLYLISTGKSTSMSYFGDASAEGDDVFFFTRQSLVGQDRDYNVDLYDARANGGIPSQNAMSIACSSEEACRGPLSLSPALGVPSSTAVAEGGNLAPQIQAAPVKPKAKPLTQRQMLTATLHACGKKPKKKRASCESRARRKYGKKANKSRGRAL